MYRFKLSGIFAILFALTFIYSEMSAQNFINNTGGTYQVGTTGGTIRMRAANGQFTSTTNTSLGRDATNRIPGTVEWARATDAQSVQARFYTDLLMSNGTGTTGQKNIPDAVYVFGAYSASGANRTYAGTFYYDGTAAQTIFAEANGTAGFNRYNNIDLAGSAKTNTAAVIADGLLNVQSTATLGVGANFTIGEGASAAAGNITVNDGTFTTTGTGTMAVNSGVTFDVTDNASLAMNSTGAFTVTGNLNLENAATAALNMGANSQLNVPGTFANAFNGRTNMTYATNSTVRYQGAGASQAVVTTIVSNRYGNLEFSGAATKSPAAVTGANDINIAGSLAMTAGGNLVMGSTVGGSSVLDMDVSGATADRTTYGVADNSLFVQGRMRLSGTIPTGVQFTMNNAQTAVQFATAPTNFEFDVQPGVYAGIKASDFDLTKDVKRIVRTAFTGTGSLSLLKVGYVASDLDATFNGQESRMRFFEGVNTTPLIAKEKITLFGHPATNSAGLNPRFAQLTGANINLVATPNSDLASIAAGSDVILGSSTLFITRGDGRWTNPGTWDEGVLPTANDNVEIRHLVYVGIAGPAYGTAGGAANTKADNTYPESTEYGANAAANSIRVRNVTDFPTQHPALIVGNEDNGDGYDFHVTYDPTASIGGIPSGIVNDGSGATTANIWDNKATNFSGGNTINGIWIADNKNATYSLRPSLGASIFTNNGNLFNRNGVLILGQ